MSGFAPGPWHAWMEGKTICVLGKERDHKKPVVTWMGFDGCNRTLEKQRANARLIAAAPDGYAANEEALDTLEKLLADLAEECAERHAQRIAVIDLTIEQLRAALAKARGEA